MFRVGTHCVDKVPFLWIYHKAQGVARCLGLLILLAIEPLTIFCHHVCEPDVVIHSVMEV